jgi:hypothetical protein
MRNFCVGVLFGTAITVVVTGLQAQGVSSSTLAYAPAVDVAAALSKLVQTVIVPSFASIPTPCLWNIAPRLKVQRGPRQSMTGKPSCTTLSKGQGRLSLVVPEINQAAEQQDKSAVATC